MDKFYECLRDDFIKVCRLADIVKITKDDIGIEILERGEHEKINTLKKGQMAVYMFEMGQEYLKIGKVGPKSHPRYKSQHYNPRSAKSTLAASLLMGVDQLIGSGWVLD